MLFSDLLKLKDVFFNVAHLLLKSWICLRTSLCCQGEACDESIRCDGLGGGVWTWDYKLSAFKIFSVHKKAISIDSKPLVIGNNNFQFQ